MKAHLLSLLMKYSSLHGMMIHGLTLLAVTSAACFIKILSGGLNSPCCYFNKKIGLRK
jgi:hypothetical protein